MGFLRSFDYYVTIQPQSLTRLFGAATAAGLNAALVQQDAEEDAEEEISRELRPRFNLAVAFAPTLPFAYGATYSANQLVELNAAAFSASTVYIANQQVSFTDGNVYICILTTTAGILPTNATYWKLLGQQNALYFIPFPYPLFNLEDGIYSVGSPVFWNGKIYTALRATGSITANDALQYGLIQNVPPPNVFPDDANYGSNVWGVGTPYSVTVLLPGQNYGNMTAWSAVTTYGQGNIISYANQLWQSLINGNTNKIPGVDIVSWQPVAFTLGDNRDRSLVKYMVDIALYHIHSSISPQNVPALRERRYRKATEWIEETKEGHNQPTFPELQPTQGTATRFGGNVKRNNYW